MATPFIPTFNGWVIFHCMYAPHLLYLFICQWTFGLFQYLISIFSWRTWSYYSFWEKSSLRLKPSLKDSVWRALACFLDLMDEWVYLQGNLGDKTRGGWCPGRDRDWRSGGHGEWWGPYSHREAVCWAGGRTWVPRPETKPLLCSVPLRPGAWEPLRLSGLHLSRGVILTLDVCACDYLT